jgi:hypothetical protein
MAQLSLHGGDMCPMRPFRAAVLGREVRRRSYAARYCCQATGMVGLAT